MLTDAGIYDVAAVGEEILLQGVADCVFETTAGLTVVDFKTDRVTAAEASQRAEAYRPQLDAYAGALSRILEKPVTERILYFFACGEEISCENSEKCLHLREECAIITVAFAAMPRRRVNQKGVNKSNEGRNPSQLSADYYQMRLR